MDLNLRDYIKIKKQKIFAKKQYINSIILLVEDSSIPDFIINSPYIYNYIIKSDSISDIATNVNKLALSKKCSKLSVERKPEECIIKEKIKKELRYLGYNLSHNGSKYLLETIYILHILDDYYNDNLEIDIYPLVAEKFKKSVHNIKCSIRYATDIMTFECEEQKLLKYLYNYKFSKPGSKMIISAILGRIK